MFIDTQVGTIATGLEMLNGRMEGGGCDRSDSGEVCKEQWGRPKLVVKQVCPGPDCLYTGPWAPCLKPLLLLSPDSRPGLGVLWATFYKSKVHRDVAAPL